MQITTKRSGEAVTKLAKWEGKALVDAANVLNLLARVSSDACAEAAQRGEEAIDAVLDLLSPPEEPKEPEGPKSKPLPFPTDDPPGDEDEE